MKNIRDLIEDHFQFEERWQRPIRDDLNATKSLDELKEVLTKHGVIVSKIKWAEIEADYEGRTKAEAKDVKVKEPKPKVEPAPATPPQVEPAPATPPPTKPKTVNG